MLSFFGKVLSLSLFLFSVVCWAKSWIGFWEYVFDWMNLPFLCLFYHKNCYLNRGIFRLIRNNIYQCINWYCFFIWWIFMFNLWLFNLRIYVTVWTSICNVNDSCGSIAWLFPLIWALFSLILPDVFPKGNIMFFCITYLLMNVFLWQC